MAKSFTFNTINSKTKYIKAIKATRVLIPETKHDFVEIPHNPNGSIMIFDKSYKDYIQPIECMLDIPNDKSIFEIGREWATWFINTTWGTLIFDDDPEHRMLAVLVSSVTIEDLKNPVITLNFRIRGVSNG